MVTISRGDVVLCDLNPVVGTEQAGLRPVIVLQIDRANAGSPQHDYCTIHDNDSACSFAVSRVCSRRCWRVKYRFRSPLRNRFG
ncbi:MAG: type II toxin-antitoxin system PemK/MazF family toxin [Methanosarcinales archaeon]